MNLKLYVIPGSHPCKAVEQAIKLKGIDYTRVDLLPGIHVPVQLALFGKRTVPGIKGDGFRMVGSRNIMRLLDSLAPEPALFPLDQDQRKLVEEAELWGDEVFQPCARAIIWPAFQRDPAAMNSYAEGSNPIIPLKLAMSMVKPVIAFEKKLNQTSDDNARETIKQLPQYLDKINRWIDEGVLGGEQPTAADLQIGSTISVLRTIADLEPIFADTQAADLARYFPSDTSRIPAKTLPKEWLTA